MTSNWGQAKIHFRVAPEFSRKVKRASLRQAVRATFESSGEKRAGELTVVITDDVQISELNRIYRGVDSPTDVLAFSAAEEDKGFIAFPKVVAYLGDVIVSYPRAVEQAAAYGHPIEEELLLLVVHGVLHLLGYDHERASDKDDMWRRQGAALAALGIHWQP